VTEPDLVFLRRPNPNEGETTVTQVGSGLFRFFQDQLRIFRERTASGTHLPFVVTRDGSGNVDGETLVFESLRNSRSILAVINHCSMRLRAGLIVGTFADGAIFTHADLRQDGAMPTDDLSAANGVVAWLVDGERTVQVRIPDNGDDLTGERVVSLPIYSAAYPLAVGPAPRPGLGRVTACGFEPNESGTWAMFESGELVQRNRQGQPILEAPRPPIEDELDRVRIQPDGAIVVAISGKEYELLRPPPPLYAAAVTRNVQLVLTAHDGQTVLWDAHVGDALQAIPVEGHHTALAFSGDGRLGLLGAADGSITVVQLLPD
jgi:hypothetical protein